MPNLTLKEAQTMINNWFKSMDVHHFNQLTNLGQLTEEVGEVARIIIRTCGDQTFKNKDEKYDLGSELADVLFSLICIADQANIDLSEAFLKNMEKLKLRDTERHTNNQKVKNNPQ